LENKTLKHLIQKPNEHNCIIYSMAMLLNTSVEDLELRLGNLGNQKIWPTLPMPYCYRSYHIQEIIFVAYQLGYAMICFYKNIYLSPTPPYTGTQIPIIVPRAHILKLLRGSRALLITERHAMAWNIDQVYDPNGNKFPLDNIYDSLIMFFLIKSI